MSDDFWKQAFIAALPSALSGTWQREGLTLTDTLQRVSVAAEIASAALWEFAKVFPEQVLREPQDDPDMDITPENLS